MAAGPVSAQPRPRAAWVAGANGLTGRALVKLLLRAGDYARVEAITRRPLLMEHPRFINRILKYEELATRLAGTRCDDAFCCLGAAGGPRARPDELRKVDQALTLAFARAAQAAGAGRLIVVSAGGADRNAGRDFRRVKGEMEAGLRELKFNALDILQPGAVLGERPGGSILETLRLMVAPLVNPLLVGSLEDSRWISGADLAAAMLGAARGQRRGINTFAGRRLQQLTTVGTGKA